MSNLNLSCSQRGRCLEWPRCLRMGISAHRSLLSSHFQVHTPLGNSTYQWNWLCGRIAVAYGVNASPLVESGYTSPTFPMDCGLINRNLLSPGFRRKQSEMGYTGDRASVICGVATITRLYVGYYMATSWIYQVSIPVFGMLCSGPQQTRIFFVVLPMPLIYNQLLSISLIKTREQTM
jgi:hypothetical protein